MGCAFHGRALEAYLLSALGGLLVAGCGKEAVRPYERWGRPPDTELTFTPVEGDTVSFRVHFYWSGYDSDGEVVAYRWTVDPDAKNPIPPARWRRTTAKDSAFIFRVDPVDLYQPHVFMVAAEDNDGLIDPSPAVRYFSAKTLPPVSRIEKGPAEGALVSQDFAFEFSGEDPDGGQLDEIVRSAPVDSFQVLLLRVGGVNDYSVVRPPWHQPLPGTFGPVYYDLIGQATGDTLLYPHGDWSWIGVRGTQKRFTDMSPGEYVFAVRAVDVAGAREQGITANPAAIREHVRHFAVRYVPPQPSAPVLLVNASVCLGPLAEATKVVDIHRETLQMFAGETISFSWSGDASSYGGVVVGYDYALDDSSQLGDRYDLRLTGVTLGPDRLTPGSHVLYVRCIDQAGSATNAVIPLLMVHPSFKDPGAPREMLYVDDSPSPGNYTGQVGSFPSDVTETNWYMLADPARPLGEARFPRITAAFPGVAITEWDTYYRGLGTVEGRKAPEARDLAGISTVVWIADLNNTVSTPLALWKSLVGGSYSALAGYLRAGGTLILSGYNLVDCSTAPSASLKNRTSGLCASFEPGSFQWKIDYFPRLFMGVDYTVPNEDGRRALGAYDFVAAYPTIEGAALGFDTAFVDTGLPATGAKWSTNSDISGTASYLDQNLHPGLPRIEGWAMMASFGCEDPRLFGREDPSQPIARAIYAYHGVPRGVAQDGGPSPREGLVCGILSQSHDLGSEGGSAGVYAPTAAVGRVACLGFPLYFMKNQQASDALFTAFSYVNASPTLP